MSKILFDWDGTIAKTDIARIAGIRRLKTLGRNTSEELVAQAQKNNTDHYKANKEIISKYTGITDDSLLTTIMTDLFRMHYIALLHEMKNDAMYPGMVELFKKLHAKGHKISIATGLRTDLIKYALKSLDIEKYFDKVYGNTPDLKYSKRDIVEMAKKNLDGVDYIIGDKEEDILAGKAVKAKTIYVTWGATGSEHKDKSDYSVNKSEEIFKIVSK